MSTNVTVLTGYSIKDVELRYTPSGAAVADMAISVNRTTKKPDSQYYESDIFNLVAFNKTAEFANNYVKKGTRLGIEGRLQTRSWVDSTSGQKRTAFEIVVNNVELLSPKENAPAEVDDPPMSTARPNTVEHKTTPAASLPMDDEDKADPFADE